MQLPGIESTMKAAGETILTPLVSLDTPRKATVQVVIVADPVSFTFVSGQGPWAVRVFAV